MCTPCGSTNINTIIDNHHWHATNSVERTRLSCWCLWNHKGCTYRAPLRYETNTWSVFLLNKKNVYSYLKCIVYDKLLKPRQSFRITLYGARYLRLQLTLQTTVIAWAPKTVSCNAGVDSSNHHFNPDLIPLPEGLQTLTVLTKCIRNLLNIFRD